MAGTPVSLFVYLFIHPVTHVTLDMSITDYSLYITTILIIYGHLKGEKVKWSHYRPGVAQRVGRGIALLFHDCSTRRGWVVSSTPRPHFTPRKDPVHILQEAGWAPGLVWMGGKSRPHRDSIPDHPACSQSLYRLKYAAHIWTSTQYNILNNNTKYVLVCQQSEMSDLWTCAAGRCQWQELHVCRAQMGV